MKNNNLNQLFAQDNHRIESTVEKQLNAKINNSIKRKQWLRNITLLFIAIIGAALFSWSLSLLIY